jgi:hypothetical protein
MRNWYSAFKAATGWGALIASLLIGTIMAGQMQETRDIMPFIQDATSCRRCHTQTVADELLGSSRRSL